MEDAAPANDRNTLRFAQHHAFIIGINAYANASPLQTAVGDALRLGEVLKAQQHFLVHAPCIDATGQDIRALLEAMTAQVGADDRVLFYFAGHGVSADGDDGPTGYILPADAELTDLKTFIPMADLQAALDALPCRHLLLILDCCFSGAFKWSSRYRAVGNFMPKKIYRERFDRFIADPAWQVITSAACDQKALDVVRGIGKATGARGTAEDDADHSPFAKALFDGLAGAADAKGDVEGDGVITATELYSYIRDQVEPQTIEAGERAGERLRQTPGFFPLKKHDKGEFIFLHPRHRLNLLDSPKRNPFKGLASFDEEDRLLFYGRDRVIEELCAKARDARLLVVSGASGTGKSSVIKAGLLPVLRQEGYRILPVLRPGAHPLAALEQALAQARSPMPQGDFGPPDPREAVLLIDQFEEVVTRCADADERKAFDARLRSVLDEGEHIHRVILTVRSDFEPQLNGGALQADWQAGRCTVPPFSLEELKEVIVMPTIQEVLIFEPPQLVDEIIAEVVQSPGALPLLSYALSELYEAYIRSGRSDRALRKADYVQLGGVMGALRTKADALHAQFDPLERNTMRKILLRMVSVEGDLAGKRVPLADLDFSATENLRVSTVMEGLVGARLIVKGTDHVEPAHDALVRAWKTLHDWIHEAKREKLILGAKLNAAANEFAQSGNTEFLWNNNPNLPVVQAELKNPLQWFNAQETDFVRKSVARKRRRSRIGWIVTAAIGISLASLAGWAWNEKTRANNTVSEARGFTDELMFEIVNQLRTVANTQGVRQELLDKVGELHAKLSEVGAQQDLSTQYWKLVLLGDIDVENKHLAAARNKYRESVAVAQPLAGRDPNWLRNLSFSYGKLGDLALAKDEDTPADQADALKWYEQSLDIDQRLVEMEPTSRILLRDLFISHLRLGDLHKTTDRLAQARQAYEAARGVASHRATHDPLSPHAHRDHARALIFLGNVAFDTPLPDGGDTAVHAHASTAQALDLFTRALRIAERLDEGPWPGDSGHDPGLLRDLLVAHGRLALLLSDEWRLDEARAVTLKALKRVRPLASAEPLNPEWQTELMLNLEALGKIESQARNARAARAALDEALKIAVSQAGANAADASSQRTPFRIRKLLGEIEGGWAGEVFLPLVHLGTSQGAR